MGYPSTTLYVVEWINEKQFSIEDGWSLNAIIHRDQKEGTISVRVLRKAGQTDIDYYGRPEKAP